jgi:phage terminase Nu1 subunit (DNA packaging protein)
VIDLSSQFTQGQFGELVGISQPAVSGLMSRRVLADGASGGEWLLAYCEHLREVAAGRGGDGAVELTTERALLAREQRDRIAMQNAVTRGELAPRALLVDVLERTAPRMCGLLESIVPALRRRSGYSAEDLAFVAQTIADARNAIAAMRLEDVLGDLPGVDDLTVEDAD